MPAEDTSPMKHMRERLVEIVAGLSLRRSLSTAAPRPVLAFSAASTRSGPYRTRGNISASAQCTDDADDESFALKTEPMKLRRKPKRREFA